MARISLRSDSLNHRTDVDGAALVRRHHSVGLDGAAKYTTAKRSMDQSFSNFSSSIARRGRGRLAVPLSLGVTPGRISIVQQQQFSRCQRSRHAAVHRQPARTDFNNGCAVFSILRTSVVPIEALRRVGLESTDVDDASVEESQLIPGSDTYYQTGRKKAVLPELLSVNYHISRLCNYRCRFCFHTSKSSDVLSIDEAKRGLTLLRQKGMEKINFAGGEPFIHADLLGALAHFCKHDLGDVAVSIILNGSLIQEDWLDQWGDNVDVLGVSVDSFVEATNDSIGRGCPGRDHLLQVKNVRSWCDDKGIKFKLNTVVNALNVDEDMNCHIAELRPDRWKVFQLLLLQGENTGGRDIRDATSLTVSPQQFQEFVARHAAQPSLVPEGNAAMQNSYLLLDERMRFLDCSSGGKVPSRGSILEVGVPEALRQAGFDRDMFIQRGGVYDWRK